MFSESFNGNHLLPWTGISVCQHRVASVNFRVSPPRAYLDTPTIAEVSCSLSLRGTSGERAGGEGLVPSNCRALLNPLSLTLSPLLRRGERESAAGVVVVSRYARPPQGTHSCRPTLHADSCPHRHFNPSRVRTDVRVFHLETALPSIQLEDSTSQKRGTMSRISGV